MKQLLLNFLFFVGAAFILFQCAKLFPTENVSGQKKLPASERQNPKSFDRHKSYTNLNRHFSTLFRPHLNTGEIVSYLNNGTFPLNMIRYINPNPFQLTHSFGFHYTDIYGRSLYPYFENPYAHLLSAQLDPNQQANVDER
jgi:hypothetical protein